LGGERLSCLDLIFSFLGSESWLVSQRTVRGERGKKEEKEENEEEEEGQEDVMSSIVRNERYPHATRYNPSSYTTFQL
jgi:hypothetical protein